MQYVRQAGTDPSFLLKALGEASGEFRHAFYGLRRNQLTRPAAGDDEGWCLLSLAVHVRDVEVGVQAQIETIAHARRGAEPEIRHVGIDDLPIHQDYENADEEEVLDEFHYLRRRTSYFLWDIEERDWEKAGLHPYRGRMTIMELARELYRHDLEHLWQARRMVDAAGVARR